MKKRHTKAAKLLLALIFLISLSFTLRHVTQQKAAVQDYSDARQLAGLSDAALNHEIQKNGITPPQQKTHMELMAQTDLSALQTVNSQVLGWISIPGSELSYPIVQGEDNRYYLNHTWKRSRSAVGAIFLDVQNQADLNDWHSIVYGHRMDNSSMFGLLHRYREADYYGQHPDVYIAIEGAVLRYEIFAAYEASAILADGNYEISFPTDADKQRYLDGCLAQSQMETTVIPTVSQPILTLSTCTVRNSATRWVVQATLAERQTNDG